MPLSERPLAEIRAPRPAHDHGLDRVARPSRRRARRSRRRRSGGCSTTGSPFARDELVRRLAQLRDRVRDIHVEQPGRVVQPLQMVGEPEDGGALRRVVAANALEHARAVVKPVDADVNLRVRPVHELAVHPDLLGLLHLGLLSCLVSGLANGMRAPPDDVHRFGPREADELRAARAEPDGFASRPRPRRPGCASSMRSISTRDTGR